MGPAAEALPCCARRSPLYPAPNGAHGAQVRARFVERFSMGAPFAGGEVSGPAFSDVAEKVSWVEKFVRLGTAATQAARCEHDRRVPASRRGSGLGCPASGKSAPCLRAPPPEQGFVPACHGARAACSAQPGLMLRDACPPCRPPGPCCRVHSTT